MMTRVALPPIRKAGAQYGFGTLWTLLFTYPLMVGIQVISARIGCVTGHGLATNLAKTNSRGVTFSLVTLLLVANTINIGADLAAMADAVALVAGGPRHIYAVALGITCLLLQVFIPYQRYVRVLKWLTLTLFAYVGTVFAVHVPWGEVSSGTLVPKIQHSSNYLLLIVAIFGTTISPYLFFWQAGQEVEELAVHRDGASLRKSPDDALRHLRRINISVGVHQPVTRCPGAGSCILYTPGFGKSSTGFDKLRTFHIVIKVGYIRDEFHTIPTGGRFGGRDRGKWCGCGLIGRNGRGQCNGKVTLNILLDKGNN